MTAAVPSARQDPVVYRPGKNKGTWPSLGIWQKVPWRKCLLNGRAGIQDMEAESRKHEQKSRKKVLCAGSLVWAHKEGKCWGSGERDGRREVTSVLVEHGCSPGEHFSPRYTKLSLQTIQKVIDKLKLKQVFYPSDQSLSRVRLFATPWITAHQASLSITNSQSSLRLTSIKSVTPSGHLILCSFNLSIITPLAKSLQSGFGGGGVVQRERETKAVKHKLPSLYFIHLHFLDFLKG